jgi:hypothetical protein
MTSGIPKYRLAKAIIDTFADSRIRNHFSLLPTTDLHTRLLDMRKDLLEDFLKSSGKGHSLFNNLSERFPRKMPRTFFLVKLDRRKYTEELASAVSQQAKKERGSAVFVNSKIRAVYLEDDGNIVSEWGLLEVPLAYERKLEYQIGDPPESEKYGEFYQTYALEHAFVWLLDEYSHGIICCSDVVALQAIMRYFRDKLSLRLAVPNLTAEMFARLTAKSETSSATFSGFPLGIPTVTVSARNVDQSELFLELEGDPEREQTSGFFRNDAGDTFASFGISRLYSRIWTPWHYSKPWLVQASKKIIDKTEEELSTEFEMDYLSYLSYFTNVGVIVGNNYLKGSARELFQKLLGHILGAHKSKREIVINPDLLMDLVTFQAKLDLQTCVRFECQNCGGGLGRCPNCLLPYNISIVDGSFYIACPKCKRQVLPDQGLLCECGTEVEMASLENHIQIYPGSFLQQAIDDFISQNLDELSWQGTFIVDGLILKLFNRKTLKKELPGILRLNQLDCWQTKAHLSRRKPNNKYLKLVGMTKEKCYRNGTPPTIEGCEQCKISTINEKQIRKNKEICLPRIFGLPIEENFDGIHHGYEIADIKYQDFYKGIPVSLGIHLKSRTKARTEGLGKSVYAIKSLYTQAFFSAYQVLKGDVDFDVIGISIPNTFRPVVIDSIQQLLNKLGYSLLVVDEDDWLKVFDAALETAAFIES